MLCLSQLAPLGWLRMYTYYHDPLKDNPDITILLQAKVSAALLTGKLFA